jgi:hypothetical protein
MPMGWQCRRKLCVHFLVCGSVPLYVCFMLIERHARKIAPSANAVIVIVDESIEHHLCLFERGAFQRIPNTPAEKRRVNQIGIAASFR